MREETYRISPDTILMANVTLMVGVLFIIVIGQAIGGQALSKSMASVLAVLIFPFSVSAFFIVLSTMRKRFYLWAMRALTFGLGLFSCFFVGWAIGLAFF